VDVGVDRLHRVVLGGRSMAAVASAEDDLRALHRIGMTGTAAVLADLAATARSRHRDTFGRLVDPDSEAFSRAWLRAGLCGLGGRYLADEWGSQRS
jgi:hypothetical protein